MSISPFIVRASLSFDFILKNKKTQISLANDLFVFLKLKIIKLFSCFKKL